MGIKKLLDRYSSREDILNSDLGEISSVTGIKEKICILIQRALKEEVNPSGTSAEEGRGKILVYGGPGYPECLKTIYDPPIVLYCRGTVSELDVNAVAIVGTRRPSDYGKKVAELMSAAIVVNGFTVVSGCALGIDSSAHRAALESRGRTIAVLGSSLEEPYPVLNRQLMTDISENGAVLSEYPAGSPTRPENFPQRNRIISGLSMGVLVIEAPKKSGALITAQQALEAGREVFAVPGGIFSSKSEGTNELIKMGAVPVTRPSDILEALAAAADKNMLEKAKKQQWSDEKNSVRKKILELLGREPLHIDKIKVEAKIDVNKLLEELTFLEIKGIIRDIGGKRFIKNG